MSAPLPPTPDVEEELPEEHGDDGSATDDEEAAAAAAILAAMAALGSSAVMIMSCKIRYKLYQATDLSKDWGTICLILDCYARNKAQRRKIL